MESQINTYFKGEYNDCRKKFIKIIVPLLSSQDSFYHVQFQHTQTLSLAEERIKEYASLMQQAKAKEEDKLKFYHSAVLQLLKKDQRKKSKLFKIFGS